MGGRRDAVRRGAARREWRFNSSRQRRQEVSRRAVTPVTPAGTDE